MQRKIMIGWSVLIGGAWLFDVSQRGMEIGAYELAVFLPIWVVGALIIVIIGKAFSRDSKSNEAKSSKSLEKKCPKCAENIKAEAKICRFCSHEFEELTF